MSCMNFIRNSFLRLLLFFAYLIACLPLSVLYLFSDILFFFMYSLFSYRKHIVRENLSKAFPQKGARELRAIEVKFFRHLADLLLEGLKAHTLSKKQFVRRCIVEGDECIERFYAEGKSIILATAHYGNWEWMSFLPSLYSHKIIVVYQTMTDPIMERWICKARGRFSGVVTERQQAFRTTLSLCRKGQLTGVWLGADQAPEKTSFWTTFLQQETGFQTGIAQLSQRLEFPIVYLHMKKRGRGRYTLSFEVLEENPKERTEEELMLCYVNYLEKRIEENPEYWLWSHRRWKYARPKHIPLVPRK